MHYLRWFTLFIVLLILPTAVHAQTTPPDEGVWLAQYWDNTTLNGEPVAERGETTIDHEWFTSSPAPGIIANDRFSARWTRTLNVPAGRYRFAVTADDGARLTVNGRLLIDAWEVQPETTYNAEIYLPGGDIPLQLDYFENTGTATIQLDWTPLDVFVQRWQGEYFNNTTLTGPPALIRDDSAVNFDWGSGSPAPDSIQPDTFSVRWIRSLDLSSGQYRFTVTSDDGVRLWVDGDLIIDEWQAQPPTTFQREVRVAGGPTPVRIDYYESGGNAEIQFGWGLVHSLPPTAVGNIVDEDATGFVRGGPDTDWQFQAEGYSNSLLWTRSSDAANPPYNWARWYPNLAAGVYDVAVYIPERFSTTSQARYWVSHSNGYTLRAVNQSVNGGEWVSLGVFEFDGSGNDFVSLADVTFENDTRLVAYDAVRWVPVE